MDSIINLFKEKFEYEIENGPIKKGGLTLVNQNDVTEITEVLDISDFFNMFELFSYVQRLIIKACQKMQESDEVDITVYTLMEYYKEKFKIIIKDLLGDYDILDIEEKLLELLKEDIL